MKRMLLIMSAALCIHAVNAMESKINFGIEPIDFSDFNKTPKFASLDKLLGLKEFDTTVKYYSLSEFVKNALKLKQEPQVASTGSNYKLDVLCAKLAQSLLLTGNGDYNCYFFINELRNNWVHLKELIGHVKEVEPKNQDDAKKPSLPNVQLMKGVNITSGPGLAWVKPALTHSIALLGGIGALKLYQLYRAR